MLQDLDCVVSFTTPEFAHIPRLALESEGIPSCFDNEWGFKYGLGHDQPSHRSEAAINEIDGRVG